jgi:hypothetical protein
LVNFPVFWFSFSTILTIVPGFTSFLLIVFNMLSTNMILIDSLYLLLIIIILKDIIFCGIILIIIYNYIIVYYNGYWKAWYTSNTITFVSCIAFSSNKKLLTIKTRMTKKKYLERNNNQGKKYKKNSSSKCIVWWSANYKKVWRYM